MLNSRSAIVHNKSTRYKHHLRTSLSPTTTSMNSPVVFIKWKRNLFLFDTSNCQIYRQNDTCDIAKCLGSTARDCAIDRFANRIYNDEERLSEPQLTV